MHRKELVFGSHAAISVSTHSDLGGTSTTRSRFRPRRLLNLLLAILWHRSQRRTGGRNCRARTRSVEWQIRHCSFIFLTAKLLLVPIVMQGNCFRARRAGNGQNGDGRRGVSGLGGARGEKSMKRAGDAAPHGRSRRAECSRGGVHALKRCSRQ